MKSGKITYNIGELEPKPFRKGEEPLFQRNNTSIKIGSVNSQSKGNINVNNTPQQHGQAPVRCPGGKTHDEIFEPVKVKYRYDSTTADLQKRAAEALKTRKYKRTKLSKLSTKHTQAHIDRKNEKAGSSHSLG